MNLYQVIKPLPVQKLHDWQGPDHWDSSLKGMKAKPGSLAFRPISQRPELPSSPKCYIKVKNICSSDAEMEKQVDDHSKTPSFGQQQS